uniref:Ribosome assembly factor mrt4 n=1 Tax=Heterosigma akashiwo TaxID=2829 RepID=A0A6V1SP53_HETAK|mmetsp:Transcript_35253/g.51496  ORF Transcript_35253/g.51496 Transcript_35253/m.51496 type:complete len:217 (+) Transcript_35253:157-807(+)
MPKSKRDKKVSLTKTDSKGRQQKQKMVQKVREAIDEFDALYTFRFDNMRSNNFKECRADWRDSRFFLGKNKLMQIALGRTPEDEYQDGLRSISKELVGNVGLLMTSRPRDEVESYFSNFSKKDFAKAGAIAPETVTLERGSLNFPAYMMSEIRKLGLTVEVRDAVLELMEDATICVAGEPIGVEAAKLLEHMQLKLATFQISLVSRWSEADGYEEY